MSLGIFLPSPKYVWNVFPPKVKTIFLASGGNVPSIATVSVPSQQNNLGYKEAIFNRPLTYLSTCGWDKALLVVGTSGGCLEFGSNFL